jgi:hypothetical protein
MGGDAACSWRGRFPLAILLVILRDLGLDLGLGTPIFCVHFVAFAARNRLVLVAVFATVAVFAVLAVFCDGGALRRLPYLRRLPCLRR